jgi:hypothetical protein
VPAGVETDKLHFTLVFHAKNDIATLVPAIIMGTRLESAVGRKLEALAGWATECREVGKGKSVGGRCVALRDCEPICKCNRQSR